MSKALELADELMDGMSDENWNQLNAEAATELRRQHAEIEDLQTECAALRVNEINLIAQVEAIQAIAPVPAVPKGWKLVPIEPTPEMVSAMHKVIEKYYNPANEAQKYRAKHTYAAMLSAAPQPKMGDGL
jgi:hypothetical protein